MSRVLILGGGFGGIATALTLKYRLPDTVEIILVNRQPHFMVGFRKTWAMLDIAPLAEGQRPLAALGQWGIVVRQGVVEQIDPANRAAVINGERLTADALVVALGMRPAPEEIPGFSQHALNTYALNELAHVRQALREFKGGKLVTGIFGTPYPCPTAPYEIAILTKEYFDCRNVDVDITVISPQPLSLGAAGQEASRRLDERMAEFGLEFLPNHKVLSIEAGAVVTDQGRLPCGLAFGVPPYVAVDAVRHSPPAAADGWIHVDRHTLETDFDQVYAVGDCIKIPNGSQEPLPKAGLFAEKGGEVAGHRIAARLAGQEPTATLDGLGLCYLETGRGEAAVVSGDFLADPGPDVRLSAMSREHFMNKQQFETNRLDRWFGPLSKNGASPLIPNPSPRHDKIIPLA